MLRDHPHVVSAERLRVAWDKAPTLQVLVGAVPDRYPLRHYDKKPLRCYRCQRHNHLQGCCTYSVKC